MKKSSSVAFGIALFIAFALSGCKQDNANNDKQLKHARSKEKVYKGELTLLCDVGLEPIIKQQVEVFEYLYDSVKINTRYVSEEEALSQFTKQKKGVVILSREVEKAERESFKKKDTLHLREMPVAYDAVALIGNNAYNDNALTIDELKSYFDPNSKRKNKRMVFDNQNSSTVNYIVGKLGYKDKVSGNVFALKTVEEVIAYVEQNTEAIGFIPYSFISDTDDDKVKTTLKRIKILSLQTLNTKGVKVAVSANQSDISDGSYPLIRKLNVISKFTYADDLEWLFMNFLYKEKGAKIFLKAGLIPVRTPEREITVNTGEMKTEN